MKGVWKGKESEMIGVLDMSPTELRFLSFDSLCKGQVCLNDILPVSLILSF